MKQILSFVTVFALAFSLFTATAQEQPKKTSSKKQSSACCDHGSKSKAGCGSSYKKSKAAKTETTKHDCKASECGDDCSYAAKAKSDDK